MATTSMTTGEKVRAARVAAGLSQRVLGERCGMCQEGLSALENDHIEPRLKTLRKIAKALGIDVKELV